MEFRSNWHALTNWQPHPQIDQGQNELQIVLFLYDSQIMLQCRGTRWLTDRDMCVRRYRKFFDDSFWRNLGLAEVSQHLPCCCFHGSIGGGNLDSMVHRFVSSHSLNIRRDLAIFELGTMVFGKCHFHNRCQLT